MEEHDLLRCPVCRNKTRVKVNDETKIEKLPLFCPKCKQETIVNVEGKKIERSRLC